MSNQADPVIDLLGGSAKCETTADLRAKLEKSKNTGKPLVIKAGFDPTAPDLHLGHTVVINRMKRFQDLGHHVVFVVGDFTALIGDPTGRNESRKPLSPEKIQENARTYQEQVFKLLDPAKTEVRFNSEWLSPLGAEGMIRLAARYTVSRMLERDDFKQRFRGELPIGIHEFLYPLLQAYDSVALEADVELGGSDQLFNLLVGRHLQRDYGQEPQVVLTMPLLEGTNAKLVDGVITGDKMSKSLGNYIGVSEAPRDQYLKMMSISDELMWRYYELLSVRSVPEQAALRSRCASSELNPRDAKSELAHELVARFHGMESADTARREGDDWLKKGAIADQEIPEITLACDPDGLTLAVAIRDAGMAPSSGEVRRRLAEGAVQVDGERVDDPTLLLKAGKVYEVRYGKKRIAKIKVGG